MQKNKTVATKMNADEVKTYLRDIYRSTSDPAHVLKEVSKDIPTEEGKEIEVGENSNLFKAITLIEFDNGILMSRAIPRQYVTFGINMLRQLQEEYRCRNVSEKATAELAAINYIRTLDIQRRINNYLVLDSATNFGLKFLAIMSKELDRANRHYLTAIQALRMTKQPRMQVNIKTDTAVIGQNQIVQSNNK